MSFSNRVTTQETNNLLRKIFQSAIAVSAWFALALQLYLMLSGTPGKGNPEKILNFFSYFTILTNLLVAVSVTMLLLTAHTGAGVFFSRPAVESAIAVYIIIVGIIYHLLLADLWKPQG